MSRTRQDGARRRNADDRGRQVGRRAAYGDVHAQAQVLRERVRSGELTHDHVHLAAALGHEAARLLEPDAQEFQWSRANARDNAIQTVGAALGDVPGLALSFGADMVVRWMLPAWWSEYPDDQYPDHLPAAVRAVRRWVRDRTPEASAAAQQEAVNVAGAYVAHEMVRGAGRPGRLTRLLGWRAAADLLGWVARVVGGMARSAGRSGEGAVPVAVFTTTDQAGVPVQGEWAMARLAAYVLGEVRVPRPETQAPERLTQLPERRPTKHGLAEAYEAWDDEPAASPGTRWPTLRSADLPALPEASPAMLPGRRGPARRNGPRPTGRQAMTALAMSFPTLGGAPGLWPEFDPEVFDRWGAGPQPSSGGRHAARFVLGVFNNRAPWAVGAFDFFGAYGTWDAEHRAAFLAWAQAPWWP